MTAILSKNLHEISRDDIDELVNTRVPEGEHIEYKVDLPTKRQRTDPWLDGKDEIGDRAKDAILEETVAFANAYGGALLLGIDETASDPPVANDISPIPRCASLAERLKLVFRDRVEPQLPRMEIFPVPICGDNGVVVIRVGRSRLAPHRVTKTLVCPVRRSNRCEAMTMREIQDMTLNVSRGLGLLEKRLSERTTRFQEEILGLDGSDGALGMRMTAIPIGDEVRLARVCRRGNLVEQYQVPWHVVERQSERGHTVLKSPFQSPPSFWRPILRGARAFNSDAIGRRASVVDYREIHCDGMLEVGVLYSAAYFAQHPVSPDWPVDLFVNLALWSDHVRTQACVPTLEYAIEVEMRTLGREAYVGRDDVHFRMTMQSDNTPPDRYPVYPNVTFPIYSLGDRLEIPELAAVFERDFWDSMGRELGAAQGTLALKNVE